MTAERGRQLPRPLRATNSVRQATQGYTVTISPAAPFKELLAAGDIADCSSPGEEQTAQRYRPLNPAGSADAARGIREFVVGTGGRGPYTLRSDPRREAQDDDTWGVLKLTLRATSHDWKFLPVAGSAYTDSGTGACH